MFLRKRLIGVAFFAAFLLSAGGMSVAAGGGVPATSGAIEGTTARIVFEWEVMGNFTAAVQGRDLNVTFDRTVSPNFSKLLGQLYPYIISAQRKADGKSITLVMDKPYSINTFKSGNRNGIVLAGIDPSKKRTPGQAQKQKEKPAEKQTQKQAQKKAPEKAPEKNVEKNEEKNAEKPSGTHPEKVVEARKTETKKDNAKDGAKAESLSRVTPATDGKADRKEKKTESPKAATAEKLPANAAPAQKPGALKAAEEKDTKEKDAEKPREQPPAVADGKPVETPAVVKSADGAVAKNKAVADGRIKVSVSAAEDSATLRFPFSARSAAAVFIRSGSLWVIFNDPVALDLSDFKSLPQTVIGKAEMVTQSGVTALRIPVDSTVLPTIAKEAGKYEWAILLAPKSRLLSNALEVQVKTDPPAPPHVFIPALEMGNTVEFRDPQVGDTLIVTPLYNLGEGLMSRREFIEFSLLETAQGIVVAKKADDVRATQLRNGLRISPNQGLTLTPGLPPVTDKNAGAQSLQTTATLFPYAQWKLPDDRDRNKFIGELQRAIVEAPNPDEANRIRMRLAQLYLSEGLAPEALAHLDSIGRTGIVFYRSAKVSALHGVANFLMARYSEAARDFSAMELNNNKEIDYWRSMVADLLGNPEPYDYLALNDDYISKYPPVFRQKLTVVAADRSVENKDYNTALKIFDTMKKDSLLEPIQDYVNYLLAVISAATGQEEEAIAMWDKLADNYKAPFVQARAEFSRILWGMERGTLDREKAIERLERLRLAWHGDNMELKVLTLLGNMYADKKDYANAMRIWDGGVSSFPNTAMAVEMERKMEDAFVNLFDAGTAGQMAPLEVLTLYYQYRSHVPGGAIGHQLVGLLADKLVAVDLLDESAALLDRQMRESEKEQRSEIGARLATVHLLNNMPEKALSTLQDSVYGDIPAPLALWRNRLLAQAFSEMGKYNKALEMVQSDLSPDAEKIRMGVYWQWKNWDKVIASVEALLKAREDVSKPLTLEESDAVLKLALAYIFEDNRVQLQYLRDYFEPLMAGNPYKPLFEFVTARDLTPTPGNFDDIMTSVSQTRSFLENYRARIQTAGLGSVMGGAENKTTAQP